MRATARVAVPSLWNASRESAPKASNIVQVPRGAGSLSRRPAGAGPGPRPVSLAAAPEEAWAGVGLTWASVDPRCRSASLESPVGCASARACKVASVWANFRP